LKIVECCLVGFKKNDRMNMKLKMFEKIIVGNDNDNKNFSLLLITLGGVMEFEKLLPRTAS
jgi:hypothetical protein